MSTSSKTDVGPEPLMTPEEAAQLLGVTRRWISRAVEEKRIPFIKLGAAKQSRLRFRRSDLSAFVEAHRHEAQTWAQP